MLTATSMLDTVERRLRHPRPPAGEDALLPRLSRAVGPEIAAQAVRTLERLELRCRRRPLDECRVLLPFGGGKDSTWALAYLRLTQLLLRARVGRTFELHLVIMLHPGTPAGVFENVENTFRALEIDGAGDVRVFATSLDGESVPLEPGSLARHQVELFRDEILVSGHLSRGNGRETFCFACNFLLMNAIARYVVDQRGELDFVVTGDSTSESLNYWKWVQKTSSRLGLRRIAKSEARWSSLFGKLAEINNLYYRRLLGPDTVKESSPYAFPNLELQDFEPPECFEVFVDTRYEYWTHERFMGDFLGFELRDDAFNFTESDCRNPLLMAHLRGLLADFEGRTYGQGIGEYLQLVSGLMEKKHYSRAMIDRALGRYRDERGVLERRREAERFAEKSFRLSPPHLAGIVASPVADRAERMGAFLRWQAPAHLDLEPRLQAYLELLRELATDDRAAGTADLEEVLASAYRERFGESDGLRSVERFFSDVLGLSLRHLRLLAPRVTTDPRSELGLVRLGDPHQAALGPGGNVITGR